MVNSVVTLELTSTLRFKIISRSGLKFQVEAPIDDYGIRKSVKFYFQKCPSVKGHDDPQESLEGRITMWDFKVDLRMTFEIKIE